jgi:hypothetical protein
MLDRPEVTAYVRSSRNFPGTSGRHHRQDIVIEVENAYFLAERGKTGDAACKCGKPVR